MDGNIEHIGRSVFQVDRRRSVELAAVHPMVVVNVIEQVLLCKASKPATLLQRRAVAPRDLRVEAGEGCRESKQWHQEPGTPRSMGLGPRAQGPGLLHIALCICVEGTHWSECPRAPPRNIGTWCLLDSD